MADHEELQLTYGRRDVPGLARRPLRILPLGPVIVAAAALVLVVAGCGRRVDSYVKEYEGGDVEVKSCQQIGETITPAGTYPDDAEDGDSEDEVWKCAIGEQDGSSGRSVSTCYVVHESKVRTIVRGVECS